MLVNRGMPFLRVRALLVWCLVASVSLFFVFSCQNAQDDDSDDEGFSFFRFVDDVERVEIPASYTPEVAGELSNKLDSAFTYLHKYKGFNGTVLVTKYNKVVYKGALGYSDFKQRDTLTTETAFQLASVSKQFTAMAIMMLKEEGDLDYDDSVQQYLPDFPYHGITIRHLLTHRSGLSNYTYFSDELWPDRKVPITNQDVLNLMYTHQPRPYTKPDVRFNYSNTGYAILASIVEEASGMPFAIYLQKHIFEPLKMRNTFAFSKDVITMTGKVAAGHTAGRRRRWPDYLDYVLGDKGLYSTVEDLHKWEQALYTQKLVKRKTLAEAFKGSRPETEKKKDEDYGFGWRIMQVESGDTIQYHGGLWHGYSTYLLRNPKDQSSIIVLSNVPNGSFSYLKDIRRIMYPAISGSSTKHSGKLTSK